jgi:hypothetical protein
VANSLTDYVNATAHAEIGGIDVLQGAVAALAQGADTDAVVCSGAGHGVDGSVVCAGVEGDAVILVADVDGSDSSVCASTDIKTISILGALVDLDEAVVVKLAYPTLLDDPVLLKNTFSGLLT